VEGSLSQLGVHAGLLTDKFLTDLIPVIMLKEILIAYATTTRFTRYFNIELSQLNLS